MTDTRCVHPAGLRHDDRDGKYRCDDCGVAYTLDELDARQEAAEYVQLLADLFAAGVYVGSTSGSPERRRIARFLIDRGWRHA